MLLFAAVLTFILGVAHSYLGERKLIQPILKMDGLPIILGNLKYTKNTLWISWHMVTLFMWGISAVLTYRQLSSNPIDAAFLGMVSVLFALFGVTSIVLSRGAHKSWIVFFPVSAITAYSAYLYLVQV